MAPRARLLAVDVDGTLLDSRHRVGQANRRALADALRAGIAVVIATSRGPRALTAVLRRLEIPAGAAGGIGVIASQGAAVGRWDGAALRLDRRDPLGRADGLAVVRAGLEAGLAVGWFSGPDWHVTHIDAAVAREARVVQADPVVAPPERFPGDPDKLMLMDGPADPAAPPDRLAQVRRRLPAGLAGHTTSPAFLDVTRDGVDKSTALARWCREREIDPAAVAAIGDGPNDVGLLAFAGLPFAPANACPGALAAARAITASNDADAVADAVSRILA
ncbi:MAG: Cof-type HAD-IIB family hydrolase [Bifidobacteriaceae bacterium]|jgi:Cof subfamily protein (haloacid dehalogenase superfamily)|nr:Cof-type HAD-IIB family hydrolase [Bifidobacteriaceae bacterium]